MKIISKIFFVLILLGVIFISLSCSKEKSFSKVTYEGYVYDSLGGSPVAGVWVVLDACNPFDGNEECSTFGVGQSKTDNYGHFYIHDNAARSNRYFPNINRRFPINFSWKSDILKVIYLQIIQNFI
jgi:hypothetical protein